jgi:hypothetical protein
MGRCTRSAASALVIFSAIAFAALVSPAAGQAKGIAETNRVRTVTLSEIPNCLPEGVPDATPSDVLRGGIPGDCVLEGIITPDDT